MQIPRSINQQKINPKDSTQTSGTHIKRHANKTSAPDPPSQATKNSSPTSKYPPGSPHQGVQLHPALMSMAAVRQASNATKSNETKHAQEEDLTKKFHLLMYDNMQSTQPIAQTRKKSPIDPPSSTQQREQDDTLSTNSKPLRAPLSKDLALNDINKLDLSAPEHSSRLAIVSKGKNASAVFKQTPSEPVHYLNTYGQEKTKNTEPYQAGVKANINTRGVLTYTIIASKETPSGSVMFKNMLDEVGKNACTILSCWRNEEGIVDNFTSYNQNIEMGYPPALAAANTFGGKMAIRSGFTDVSVKPQGSHVDVEFSVPKELIGESPRRMDP